MISGILDLTASMPVPSTSPMGNGFPQDVTFPDVSAGPTGPLTINLPTVRCTPAVVEQLRYVLGNHPGTQEVRMRLMAPAGAKVWRLDDRLRVATSPSLMAELKALLGPSCVGV